MDDAAWQSWYQSFLAIHLTDTGEPRLICSYKTIFESFHGFSAWLTEAERVQEAGLPALDPGRADVRTKCRCRRRSEFLGLGQNFVSDIVLARFTYADFGWSATRLYNEFYHRVEDDNNIS